MLGLQHIFLRKEWLIRLNLSHKLWVKIGEGNSNPLQYSCLENPMDGGA